MCKVCFLTITKIVINKMAVFYIYLANPFGYNKLLCFHLRGRFCTHEDFLHTTHMKRFLCGSWNNNIKYAIQLQICSNVWSLLHLLEYIRQPMRATKWKSWYGSGTLTQGTDIHEGALTVSVGRLFDWGITSVPNPVLAHLYFQQELLNSKQQQEP